MLEALHSSIRPAHGAASACVALALLLSGCSAAPSGEPSQGASASSSSKEDSTQIVEAADQQSKEAVSTVEETLRSFAEKDADVVKETLSAVGFDPADYGATWSVFAETYYQDFAYSVEGIAQERDGKDAVGVAFSVTVPNMAEVTSLMRQASKDCIDGGANASKAGYANKAWKKAWSKSKVKSDQLSATLYVAQQGNTWEIQDKESFAALLLDGYDPRQA